MDISDLSHLSSNGLCDALQDKIHESALLTLREETIDGAMFLKLTEDDLKDLFPQVGARLSVAMVLRERCSTMAKASDVPARNKDKVQDRLIEITPAASQWVFTFEIPEKFTRSTMKGLSEGQVTSIARTEIVSALHTRMLQYKEFPTPFEYKTACRRLVEKYPCFVDKSESGYGTWKEQLKQKFRNGRRGAKRSHVEASDENEPPTNSSVAEKANKKRRYTGEFSIDPTQDENETYLAHLQELTEEQKRDNPSVSKVKRLMKSTFTGRRSWIQKDTPSVSDIIDVFPALKQSNRIRRELTLIIGAEKDTDFFKDWQLWVEKILSYGQKESETRSSVKKIYAEYLEQEPSQDTDVKTLGVIHLLHALLATKSKEKILHEFSDVVDVDEEAEKLPPFPQIVVLRHSQQQQYYIVVEKNVLLESDGIEGSILDLISAYFTFDISYPKKLYPVLLFIQHIMLNIVDKQRVPNNVTILRSSLM